MSGLSFYVITVKYSRWGGIVGGESDLQGIAVGFLDGFLSRGYADDLKAGGGA